MRYSALLTFCALGFCAQIQAASWITNADDITEEWLIEAGGETGYTEHVAHFKQLFSTMNVRTLLEFGCGFSTKYFIDNCQNVISAEFVTNGTGPDWLKYCMGLYAGLSTWKPVAYFSGTGLDTSWATNKYIGLESVYQAAAYQPVTRQSYAPIDPSFLQDLSNYIQQEIDASGNSIDVAFVDCGVCLRGDLVQSLFNKVPVIVAHDVAPPVRRQLDDVYGYGRVVAPDNYQEIFVPFGLGTAFWVKKDPQYQDVIAGLQAYVENGTSK